MLNLRRFGLLLAGLCCSFLGPAAIHGGPPSAQEWWSLRPLRRPAVPEAAGAAAGSVRNPIDSFVLARLREKGLTPGPEADRRTLIRRLSFDLIGLPPAPEEIAAFLADPGSDAYERLVDRLLASPRHGERWARHWMDTVHFAETHGHDQDRVRPHAWPYRDYLIAAFNADRPYSRFVEEQIAADALFPEEPDRIPALGFLAAGPWDESSLRDIREDSIDRQVGHYLDRDDMVSTAIATFQSLTIHCARCHDHKFDPIPQDDYYALQAVFAGVGRADRSYDPDPAVDRRRRELRRRLAALERRDPEALEMVLEPAFLAEVEAWERRGPRPAAWKVLDPATFTSASGATLTELSDHSILSGGARPERDTTTITAPVDLPGITAVRLEVLPDDSLPKKGPGRQDNGNLHLSEFRLLAALPGGAEPPRPVEIAGASADFDQEGWMARHAVDGQAGTAWGIYPEVGKPHQAVFETREDLSFPDGTLLRFVLEQEHGGGHLIGRARLSVTSAPRPVRAAPFPDDVAAALAVPSGKRTKEERLTVGAHYLREQLQGELAALPPQHQVYAIAGDFTPDGSHKPPGKPRPVHVLKRGDIHAPLKEARPGTLGCVAGLPSRFALADPGDEASRRAALARWITGRDNLLTWRSIVNRIWQRHFAHGIADTPNDFGRMGGLPTHPELLDWLAVEFRDGGQSLKALHRLIVTSAAYRRSSAFDPANARIDAENRYLWRMSPVRLDAECVRDAILLAGERLNLKGGGPSDQEFAMQPGIHVTPLVDYQAFSWDRPEGHRRGVYRFVFRTLPDPFLDCLDAADPSQLTPVRNVSVSALQALALLNGDFILAASQAFAGALERASDRPDRRLAIACERAWGRPPTAEESEEMAAYAAQHGLANLCRLLFNSSAFLFVD
jgi:hypothetical protein